MAFYLRFCGISRSRFRTLRTFYERHDEELKRVREGALLHVTPVRFCATAKVFAFRSTKFLEGNRRKFLSVDTDSYSARTRFPREV